MFQLALWIAACFVVSVLLAARPVVLIACILVLRFGIPSPAGQLLEGSWEGAWAIHPASWLILSSFVVLAYIHFDKFETMVLNRLAVMSSLAAVVVFTTVMTADSRGLEALLRYFNVFVIPLLLMVIVLAVIDSRGARVLWCTMVAIGLVQSCMGILQYSTNSALVFSSFHKYQYWWPADGRIDRALGTLDSPMDLAMFLAVCLALCLGVRNPYIRWLFALILGSGILVTQSRLGVGIAGMLLAIYGTYGLLRGSFRERVLIGVSVLVLPAILTSSLAVGVSERWFVDDGNSLGNRTDAYDYFFAELLSHTIIGDGFGSSFELFGTVIRTSLESGYAIFVFDFGLLVTLIILAIQGYGLMSAVTARSFNVATALLVAIIMCFGFSSFATQGSAAVTLWLLVALAFTTRGDVGSPRGATAEASRRF